MIIPPTINTLTVEEKVGQILMVHFVGSEANEEAEKLIRVAKVGSFIFYNWSNELSSPEQIKKLTSSLQKLSQEIHPDIPVICGLDQEGGRVQRGRNGFTPIESAAEVGAKGEKAVYDSAFKSAQELKEVGINMNLAPVADINSNPQNPIIGNRAYGTTAEAVSKLVKHALAGYKAGGVIPTLKHFPGHGDVVKDSHKELPVINKTVEELNALELQPFRILAPTCDVIMTGHLFVPKLDNKNCSTLSRKTIALLRNELKFKGVVISDSLVMQGVLQGKSLNETALKAFNAGCDLLLLGGGELNSDDGSENSYLSYIKVHAFLVQAVKEGKISNERLDSAVTRILELKKKINN